MIDQILRMLGTDVGVLAFFAMVILIAVIYYVFYRINRNGPPTR